MKWTAMVLKSLRERSKGPGVRGAKGSREKAKDSLKSHFVRLSTRLPNSNNSGLLKLYLLLYDESHAEKEYMK
jgi:hypothetical protein